ncbi:MAG: exo-alpha-sialidase [Planctomycetaceae bacterium]|nr:exo-alpha-sialidase [Planctomycetaceae bacterium]
MIRLLLCSLLVVSPVVAAETEETVVFSSGQDGYHTFRIPAVVATQQGTLLAFCEGRKSSGSDTGDIDLVLRRSSDGGKTWSPLEVIWDDGANTCGNPCPVVDESTGTIWLLLTWNSGNIHEGKIQSGFGADSRRVFVSSSTDDGKHWSTPTDITSVTKLPEWSWYATGPGAGIQKQHGPHAGRLVIPCDHKIPTAAGTQFRSHVIYSDDHGATWQLGGVAPRDKVNECEVVELNDGRLLLNMRNYDRSVAARQICFSSDGGETWTDQRHDPALVEPTCQASVRRVGEVLVFSNPGHPKSREALTIRLSRDDGKTWPESRVLFPGSSAYSCLVELANERIGCLYERNGYKQIVFAVVDCDWVSQGME